MNIKLVPKYVVLRILLLSAPFLCYYDRKITFIALAGLFTALFLFRPAKQSDERKYSFCFLPVEGKEAREMLFLITSLFVIVKFFEQDIAVFSISIALIYRFVSSGFSLFSRIRIRSITLEGAVVGAAAVYFAGEYLCGLLGLDKNIAVSSAVAAPLIELILSWPDKNFSVPFFIAVVAQFVKNSF